MLYVGMGTTLGLLTLVPGMFSTHHLLVVDGFCALLINCGHDFHVNIMGAFDDGICHQNLLCSNRLSFLFLGDVKCQIFIELLDLITRNISFQMLRIFGVLWCFLLYPLLLYCRCVLV